MYAIWKEAWCQPPDIITTKMMSWEDPFFRSILDQYKIPMASASTTVHTKMDTFMGRRSSKLRMVDLKRVNGRGANQAD